MKAQKIIKSLIITSVSLYLSTLIIPGFIIDPGIKHIAITAIALSLLNVFIKPLIKLMLLPINIVTLGTLRWLTNIILLYLLTLILPDVNIQDFTLSNIAFLGQILPHIQVGKFIATIIVSITLSLSQTFLLWVIA